MRKLEPNHRPGVDARSPLVFAFQRPRPRSTQAGGYPHHHVWYGFQIAREARQLTRIHEDRLKTPLGVTYL